MKNMNLTFALVLTFGVAFSGCSTMLMKNPEMTAPVAAAAPAEDTVASTAAAPAVDNAPAARAQRILSELSDELRFNTNSAQLKRSAVSGLKELAQILSQEPSMKINVDGFTDSTGPQSLNRKLSVSRAFSVKQVLASNGIPASRISAQGHAAAQPMADNNTEAGRAQNRRAQLSIK